MPVRHLAFIRHLASVAEHSQEWRALSLAYRGVLLADHALDTRRVSTSAVDALIAECDPFTADEPMAKPVRAIALAAGQTTDWTTYRLELSAAVLTVSAELRRRCRFELALDASTQALRLAMADPQSAWRAHRDCGRDARMSGEFERSIAHYWACVRIGLNSGDPEPVFFGHNGLCLIVQSRGNLPRAEAMSRRLVAWIQRRGRPELIALGQHVLAITLGMRGRLEESLEILEAALPLSSAEEYGRVLGNIAVTHLRMGNFVRARDLYLEQTRGRDAYQALVGHMNLTEIYAQLGEPAEVERHRQPLDAVALPPGLAVDYEMTLGKAYTILGKMEAANEHFDRASALAERSGFGMILIEADKELEQLARSRQRQPGIAPSGGIDSHAVAADNIDVRGKAQRSFVQ